MTTAPILSGQDISAAANATRPLLDRVIEPAGLSFPDWAVLRLLAMHGGPVAREAFVDELARSLSLERPTATQLLDRAASLGRVEGEGSVRLSAEGAALYDQLWAQIRHMQARLYAGMDPNELEITRRVLAEVTRRANELLTV